jgi:protein-tyrosine-phosphatase
MAGHSESIYNLIPPAMVQVERQPMHKSKFSGTIPPTCSTFHVPGTSHPHTSNMAGSAEEAPVKAKANRTFGKVPGALKEDPAKYLKGGEKTEKVETLASVKKTNPATLQPSQLSKRVLPGVPRHDEAGPPMNLVTSKNFVVANAVEVILAAPRKTSQGAKDYLHKEDYGKVPKYLEQIKTDINAEYDYIRQLQEQAEFESASRVQALDKNEQQMLLEGLKAKWEAVNTEYQGQTHLTKLDSTGKKARKEKYEAELSQIEKDIEKLAKKNIIVDHGM